MFGFYTFVFIVLGHFSWGGQRLARQSAHWLVRGNASWLPRLSLPHSTHAGSVDPKWYALRNSYLSLLSLLSDSLIHHSTNGARYQVFSFYWLLEQSESIVNDSNGLRICSFLPSGVNLMTPSDCQVSDMPCYWRCNSVKWMTMGVSWHCLLGMVLDHPPISHPFRSLLLSMHGGYSRNSLIYQLKSILYEPRCFLGRV